MKSLVQYLKEEIFAMPCTTIGMGNVAGPGPDNGGIGSGDMITPVCTSTTKCSTKLNKRKKKQKNKKTPNK